MQEALPYSKLVEKHILECIQGGVGIRQMIASMQHLQDAPKSLSTMYKIYGNYIEAERAKINGSFGKKVIDQALAGDFKLKSCFFVVRVVGPLRTLSMRLTKRLTLTWTRVLLTLCLVC